VAGVEAVESTSMPKLADSVSISVCDKTLFISSENLTRVDLCNALVPDADKNDKAATRTACELSISLRSV
jgi:hypothetical protein